MKRYFKVTCMRGHGGFQHSISEITFVFETENLLKAMDMAKRMPSVKHTRMIVSGKEITKEEYFERRQISAYKQFPIA